MTVLSSLAIMSCTSDGGDSDVEGNIPIILTVDSSANATRASFLQDVNLISGQKLFVWAKRTNTSTDYLKTWVLTANGSGGFTNSTKYYPADGTNLDLYALHGNFNYTEDDVSLPTEALSHAVLTDQRSDANYATSDLLATRVTDKGPKGNAGGNSYKVPLSFSHLLCRIEIEITTLDYLDAPDIDHIELVGVKTTNTVTMPTYSNASATVSTATATPTADIKMRAGSTHAIAECIIPAQSVAQNASFIRVVLVDNHTLTYKASQAFDFDNQKSYRFEMKIEASKIQAYSVTVKSWDELSNQIDYYVLQTIDNTETTVDETSSSSQDLYWEYGGGENGAENLKGEDWFP